MLAALVVPLQSQTSTCRQAATPAQGVDWRRFFTLSPAGVLMRIVHPSSIIILLCLTLTTCLAQVGTGQRIDSLEVSIAGVPDSAREFAVLEFDVRYNTAGRDLCLNVSVLGAPNNEGGRNFGVWVNGTGTQHYSARVPGSRKAQRFSVAAYLTNDGRWSGRELYTSSDNHRIISGPMEMVWKFGAPSSVRADSVFTTTVEYRLAQRTPVSIPFLIVELLAPDGRVLARQIEWSVPDSGRFAQRWTLPAHAFSDGSARTPIPDACTMRLRARLEDEEYSATAPALASAEGPLLRFSGATGTDFGRVAFRRDTLLLDGKQTFLHGVDVFSFWYAWPDSVIIREAGRMHAAGLTFARVFLDWERVEPQRGRFSDATLHSIATLLRATDSLGIWIELVPAGNWGGWIFDLYKEHWWTDPVSIEANTGYFERFGRCLDSLGARNILYVSVMQEGSWYYDWFDPFTSGSYPGPVSLAQADADWRGWLAERGTAHVSFDSCDAELFSRWAAERFTELLQRRASAFRRGSRNRYAVGAAGAQGGTQYTRRIYSPHPSCYALPEFWAHTVDCVELHTYTPVAGDGYWSGSTGLRTFREWTAPFRKPINVGEINWTYADASIDMGVDSCWRKLREDLTLVRDNGYIGYGIWAWMDYDARKLGINDRQFGPRPVLDSLTRWIRGQAPTGVAPAAALRNFRLEAPFPNPFPGATTLHFTVPSRCEASIDIFDALGRRAGNAFRGIAEPGSHSVRWDASALSAGWYIARLAAGGIATTTLLQIVR
jgi:hypothetical protein